MEYIGAFLGLVIFIGILHGAAGQYRNSVEDEHQRFIEREERERIEYK